MCCVRPSTRVWLTSIAQLLLLLTIDVSSVVHAQAPGAANNAASSAEKSASSNSDATAEEQKEKLAADKFLEVLIKKPATGTALDRVFGYHVERGSISGLIDQLKQTAQLSSNLDEVGRLNFLIGLLHLQRGDDAQAVKVLEQAQNLLKENSLAAFHYGQALLLIGNTDGAASAFESAIARKPARNDYLNIARELGRLYQRAGKADEALRIWNDLEKNFPGDDSVRGRIAATLVEEGDLAGALVRYTAMAKAAKSENDRVVFSLDAARLRSQLSQKDQAIADLDGLLTKLRPGSYLYDEARRRIETIFLSNGDYAGLTKYYESWLQGHADDLNVILRLARTLSLQGRSTEAIERFEQAIQRAPNDEAARLACIDAYMTANRVADAASQYEALIKAHPNNPDYLVRYGQALMSDKNVPEAQRARAAADVWKSLVEAKPKDAAVQSQVADLLRGAKLTDEAIAGYRAAIALAPDEPQHKEYLGEYLHQLKRTDEALVVWRSLAEGNARNLDNLVRLAEVLHQFEQPAEALQVMSEACQMKPKVIHRLRYVEWLSEAKEFDKAYEQLALAQEESESTEDRARTFSTAVKTYKATGKLAEQIQKASEALQATPTDGQQWRQLAVLHEANENAAEALKAIEKALAAEPNSIETLDIAARMTEASGRVAEAIDLRKRLVDLDRRFRSAHLQRLATLHTTAGQSELAISTGKELLASAGGAIEASKFYADLCGQLGRTEERLDTLRRCLRLNPRSLEAMELLSNQLADDFKTDQAIELVWKQLDLTDEIEKRRTIVIKLTDLYLRSNRLDQLISRLEFRGREANDRRTAIDLTATAYQQAGDLGLAREALESLLRESGRDTLLMERLVALAQQAGEMDRAVELQRELVRLTPGKQAETRLAGLLIDIGAVEEAQSLWLSSVDIRGDLSPLMRAIEQMFNNGEYKLAFDMTSKLLDANPSDWELLTLRMVLASVASEWDSASKDAQSLLSLNLPDKEESNSVKQQRAKQRNQRQVASTGYPAGYPAELAQLSSANQLLMMLDPRYGYRSRLPAANDFGTAKVFAKFVLLKHAEDNNQSDAMMAKLKEAAMSAQAQANDVWDWYRAETLVARMRNVPFEDFRNPAEWNIAWRLVDVAPASGLQLLANQFANRQQYASNNEVQLMPLPPERLEWLKDQSQKSLDDTKANISLSRGNWTAIYASELAIAGKKEEAEQLLKQKKNWPSANGQTAYEVLAILQQQGNDDEYWQAIEESLASDKPLPQQGLTRTNLISNVLTSFTDGTRVSKKLSAGPEDATYRERLMKLVDLMISDVATRPVRGNAIRMTSIGGPRQTYQIIGGSYESIVLEFPPSGLGPDDEYIRNVYLADQQLKGHHAAWIERLTKPIEAKPEAAPDARVQVARLATAAFLQQWHDQTGAAKDLLEQALKLTDQVPQQESTLRLLLADLLLRQNRKQEALAMIEQLSVYDQNTMAVREFAAARLASLLGDKARAEQAARRLLGVRLDPDAQIELAKLMRGLNMNDLAADVVRRLRGRTGGSTAQLQTLLNYFTSQNDKEAAAQVAMDLLQRTVPTPRRTNGSMTSDQALRNRALQALSSGGQLKPLIDNTKKRLERAPNSQRIRAELSEMYRVSGQVKELEELLSSNKKDQKLESTAALELQAKQLFGAGKATEACDAYLKVLRRNPQLLTRDFYEILNPFEQTTRLGDLADMVIETGLQKFDTYRVSEICDRLLRDQRQADKARRLFEAMLQQRNAGRNIGNWLNNVSDNYRDLIKDQDMLVKVIDAIVGVSLVSPRNTWSEAFYGYSTDSDGRKGNCLTALIRFVADKPEMAQTLEKRLREEIAKKEDWQEGKFWLGLTLVAMKRYDEAKPLLEPIVDSKLQGNNESLWLIASLIDSHPPMVALAEKLYDEAMKDFEKVRNNYSSSEFQYTLPGRVSKLMLEQGNKARAREIVLNELESRGKNTNRQTFNDPEYVAYQAISETMSLMKFLTQVDAQVDALKLARKLDRSNFAKAARYGSTNQANFDKQVKEIEDEVRRKGGLVMLETMIDAETKGPSAVDLGISLDDRPFTGNGLKSLWQEMIAEAVRKPEAAEATKQLVDRLQKLQAARPEDASVRYALSILNSYVGSSDLLKTLVNAAEPEKADATAENTKAGDKLIENTNTLAQWQAIAYLRWTELDQAPPAKFDVAKIERWLTERASKWPIEYRANVLASLGKRQLSAKDESSAKALWTMCLKQSDATQWLLVDLAIAAARENMPELSLECATQSAKAIAKLPSEDKAKAAGSLGELLGTNQRNSVPRSISTNIDDDAGSVLATRLIELDNTWTQKKLDAKSLIAPLKAWMAFDDKNIQPRPIKYLRSNEYVQSGSGQWKLESVFDRLARRASAAGQTEDLVKQIVGDAASPEGLAKGDVNRAILAALAWLRNDRGDKTVDYLKAVDVGQLATVHRTILLQVLVAGLEDKTCRRTAAELGLQWAITNKPTERYSEVAPFDSLALEIVRKSIQHNMNKELRSSAVATYLELCQFDNDRYQGSSRTYRAIPQLEEIIKLYLNQGDNVNALLYLEQRQALINQGLDRDEDWLSSWLLENIQSKNNRLQAYQVLIDWTFRGDTSVNNLSAFSRRAPLPDWIPESIGGKYPNFAPLADKSLPVVTSFYSLALLSAEVQQSDALVARYEAARQQKRAGATVGLAITLAALKRPVPDELLTELNEHLVAIRPAENAGQASQSRFAAPLAELNLALILNANREHLDWVRETVNELQRHAAPVNRAFLTPWLNRFSLQQGWSSHQAFKTGDGLKHWTQSTGSFAKEFYEGKTAPMWLTDDQDQVVHVCGYGTDWLCWRYPLKGNFEFEFESQDASRQEMEVYVCGLRFTSTSTYVDVQSEDSRDWLRLGTTAVKKNEWNKHTVTFTDEELKYSINGELIYKEARSPGQAILALRSPGQRYAVSRNIKFSGKPEIAQSLPLLNGDHLRGWYGSYYSQSVPSSKLEQTKNEKNQYVRAGTNPNDRANLNWTVENGELVSADATNTGPGKQSVLQYCRPMCAGDVIEYEFYYEPGKFGVHPCFGRTAFLLRPDGIARHWMTEPNTSWKTPEDNSFAIPGAKPLILQPGTWNKARLETQADRLLISINGQLALELPWQLELPQNSFGLFHFQDKSQVRVRNLTMTGSWPTEMPSSIFER